MSSDKQHPLQSPRWIVISDYPNSPYEVGHIIHEKDNLEGRVFLSKLSDYPAIFRKLEWWEYRKIKEMPKKIKFVQDYMDFKKGSVYKFENWGKQFEAGMIPFRSAPGKYNLHAIPPSFNQLIPL